MTFLSICFFTCTLSLASTFLIFQQLQFPLPIFYLVFIGLLCIQHILIKDHNLLAEIKKSFNTRQIIFFILCCVFFFVVLSYSLLENFCSCINMSYKYHQQLVCSWRRRRHRYTFRITKCCWLAVKLLAMKSTQQQII